MTNHNINRSDIIIFKRQTLKQRLKQREEIIDARSRCNGFIDARVIGGQIVYTVKRG